MSAIFFARFDSNGRYTMSGTVPADSPTLTDPDVYIGRVDITSQYHDPAVGGPVDMPPRPTPEHHFDFVTKTWLGDAQKVKARKHAEIEAERDRQLNDPIIVYDNLRLDATAGSKQNLQDKITATAGRIGRGTPTPPQMLVWRDADNVVHGFDNLKAYKDWLDGFAIALENRGMQAWAWSWQKKDELEALTTFDDIYAFDPLAAPLPATPRK